MRFPTTNHLVTLIILLTALVGSQFLPSSLTTLGRTPFTRQALNDEAAYPWFGPAYRSYLPQTEASNALHKQAADLSFLVFAGSWCPDTRKWLPLFYKIVESAGIRPNKILLTPTDHDHTSDDGSAQAHNVDFVPTFIVYYKGKEKGRLANNFGNNMDSALLEIVRSAHAQLQIK